MLVDKANENSIAKNMTIDLNVLGVLMKGGAVQDKKDGVI